MKVTVCFGSTKVIVPCGDGQLLVSELIEKATTRYKKASGKTADYWLIVHSLKSSSDGGILDPDDQLKDVADDREQIVAYYEEQEASPVPHNGGDGTSASSVGTSSPDIFRGPGGEYREYHRHGNNNDVIITKNDLNLIHTGSSLIVRRGSEPALTKIIPDEGVSHRSELSLLKAGNTKRWSAIGTLAEVKSPPECEADDEGSWDTPPPTLERVGGIGQEEGHNSHNSSFSTFSRGSSRRSLANNAAMIKWLEAQEKAQENIELKPGRKEPLGGREEEDIKINGITKLAPTSPEGQLVVIENTSGPLGIHVVPELDESAREKGLLIQSVEAGGRIYRDGRIHTADVIVAINGTNLTHVSFSKAQEIFRQALHDDCLRLHIQRAAPPLPSKPPPIGQPLSVSMSPPASPTKLPNGHSSPSEVPASPPASPTKGPPPPIPARNPTTALSSARFTATNTRKLGKKLCIELTKGPQGLGFSVTTRDNPAGGHAPIYIKNILPKGAAIEDGRLKPGDRLLEVNDTEMTGKSQTDVVAILRNTKISGSVKLVVSRQVLEDEKDETDTGSVQNKSDDSVTGEDVSLRREVLSFDVPLGGKDAVGLGLNVKGKTLNTQEGVRDLGIFIKAIIPDGAAAQDGRAQVNDQLLEVNGDRLEGKTNPQAMEVLRSAVQKDGDKTHHIRLVVSRKVTSASNLATRSQSVHEVRISQSDNRLESVGSGSINEKNAQVANTRPSIIGAPPGGVPQKPNNLMLARLQREQSLRNTSYQIANHDSLVNDTIDSVFADIAPVKSKSKTTDADDLRVRMRISSSTSTGPRARPASTLGFLPAGPEPRTRLSVSKSNQDLLDSGAAEWGKDVADKSDKDPKSPTDDLDASATFSREGFGRQSMSEKRKGHMDPKVSEFYQKIKAGKDGSTQYLSASWDPRKSAFQQVQAQADEEFGPTLGLKKSSSLESLQRAEVEAMPSGDNDENHANRGRGINESFRAAVDRSYDNQPPPDAMETVEEESESGSVINRDFRNPSFSSVEAEKKNKKNRKEKEKGIFKGLFKFGKTKKPEEKGSKHLHDDEVPGQRESDRLLESDRLRDSDRQRESDRLRESDRQRQEVTYRQTEENRYREHQRMLQEKQRQIELQKQREEQQRMEQQPFLRPASPPPRPPQGGTRADKITQLRMEHQRRHRERSGHYPLEDEEEELERQLQEYERQKISQRSANDSGYYGHHAPPPRQRYDDSLTYERARPAFADPEHMSHYQNLAEIQNQLRKHEYYQQRYHQQTPGGTQHYHRPVATAPPPGAADPRYHQRGYVTPHHDHRAYHSHPPQGYYTPSHPAYRTPEGHAPGYHPHPAHAKATPQIVVNPPPHEYTHPRSYSDFDEPRAAYREPPYGSLPRRRDHRDGGMIPGAAQV